MPIRASSIRDDVQLAKSIVKQKGVVSEAELFMLMQVGINKFYWIKRILKEDPELVFNNGYFTVRGREPKPEGPEGKGQEAKA
jgi:hypothetical protein